MVTVPPPVRAMGVRVPEVELLMVSTAPAAPVAVKDDTVVVLLDVNVIVVAPVAL